jgi:transposase InsO family protein
MTSTVKHCGSKWIHLCLAERVIRVLEMLIEWRGHPAQIRMDNGPELISHRLKAWAEEREIILAHIQPGKPAQNAYVERFNRTFREDVLDAYLFDSLLLSRKSGNESWRKGSTGQSLMKYIQDGLSILASS